MGLFNRVKGGIKTGKTDYIAESERARQRAAKQAYILKGPAADTYSSRMPAYCYTVLCPVPELRGSAGHGQIEEGTGEN